MNVTSVFDLHYKIKSLENTIDLYDHDQNGSFIVEEEKAGGSKANIEVQLNDLGKLFKKIEVLILMKDGVEIYQVLFVNV